MDSFQAVFVLVLTKIYPIYANITVRYGENAITTFSKCPEVFSCLMIGFDIQKYHVIFLKVSPQTPIIEFLSFSIFLKLPKSLSFPPRCQNQKMRLGFSRVLGLSYFS